MKYDGIASSALALITRKGAAVVISRASAASFDPVTQQETTPSTTSETFQAVALPPGKSAESVVGSLVDRNLVELHIAQKNRTMTPKNGDVVAISGVEWTIIWTATYDPAGDGAIYTKAYAER